MSRRKRTDEIAEDIVTQTGSSVTPQEIQAQKQSCLSDPSRNQIHFLQTMSRIFRQQSQLMTQHAQVLDSLWNPSAAAAVHTADKAIEDELYPDSTNHLAIHPIHTTNPFKTTDSSDIIILDTSHNHEKKAANTSFARRSTANSSKTLVNSWRGIPNTNGDARQTSSLPGNQNESIDLSSSTALVVSRTSTTVPDSTSTRKIRDLTKQLKTVQSTEKEKMDSSRKRKAR
jgi:hypothetical protein